MNEPNEKIQLDDISFDDVMQDVLPQDGLEDLAIDTPKDEEVEEEVEDIVEDPTDDEDEYDEDEYDEDEDEDEDEDDYDEDEDEEDEDDEDDEDEEDEEVYDASVVNEVLANLGYDPTNEYEDTPEGLTKMTQEVASKLADERIDDLLEEYPNVKAHLEYVMNGGESNTFLEANHKEGDYELLEIREDDINTQRNVLGNYLHLKGHDKDFINELLEDYEDNGKLLDKATLAKDAMSKYQQEHRSKIQEEQRLTTQQQTEQNNEFWSGVANTIQDSREFAGIKITEREKKDFYHYISQPVDKAGKTQRDLDHLEADMDVKLAIDYLMYKGFNLDEIVGRRAKTKSTQSLRAKLSKNEEDLKSTKRKRRTVKNVDFDDLDLSI